MQKQWTMQSSIPGGKQKAGGNLNCLAQPDTCILNAGQACTRKTNDIACQRSLDDNFSIAD